MNGGDIFGNPLDSGERCCHLDNVKSRQIQASNGLWTDDLTGRRTLADELLAINFKHCAGSARIGSQMIIRRAPLEQQAVSAVPPGTSDDPSGSNAAATATGNDVSFDPQEQLLTVALLDSLKMMCSSSVSTSAAGSSTASGSGVVVRGRGQPHDVSSERGLDDN